MAIYAGYRNLTRITAHLVSAAVYAQVAVCCARREWWNGGKRVYGLSGATKSGGVLKCMLIGGVLKCMLPQTNP